MVKTIELQDCGILIYDDAFLPADLADRYFVDLQDNCAWEQKPGIFGHIQPRLIASYGDTGATYRYSGVDNVSLPLTDTLLEIKSKGLYLPSINWLYCSAAWSTILAGPWNCGL